VMTRDGTRVMVTTSIRNALHDAGAREGVVRSTFWTTTNGFV
jgi:hypothetical protein